jgi:hypothetical protein
VLVFLFGLSFPLLDRGQTFDRFAFVSHDAIFGKALRQGLRIIPVLSGDVDSDGRWKVRNHTEM